MHTRFVTMYNKLRDERKTVPTSCLFHMYIQLVTAVFHSIFETHDSNDLGNIYLTKTVIIQDK